MQPLLVSKDELERLQTAHAKRCVAPPDTQDREFCCAHVSDDGSAYIVYRKKAGGYDYVIDPNGRENGIETVDCACGADHPCHNHYDCEKMRV